MKHLRSWLLRYAGDVALRAELADVLYHLGREIQRSRSLLRASERDADTIARLRAEVAELRRRGTP